MMNFIEIAKKRYSVRNYSGKKVEKEKLDKMEEQAKRELGMLSEKEFSPEDIRGKFVEGTTHLKRRKESGRKPVHLGVILLIIALLLFLWHYLQTGSWAF